MKPRIWFCMLLIVLPNIAATGRADLVVMRFGASWCRECLVQDRHFQATGVRKTMQASNIKVFKYDADKHPKAYDKYKVQKIPFMLLVDYDLKKNTARVLRATKQGQVIPASQLSAWLTPPVRKKNVSGQPVED